MLAFLAFATPELMSKSSPATRTLDEDPRFDNLWRPFNLSNIPALVAKGKIVFIDLTAEWCLTCKINKFFIIGQDDILERLGSSNVIAMQADWTLPDEAIATYLVSFGRYGIPFNAVYGPNAPTGIALPELLSHDVVVKALNQAR